MTPSSDLRSGGSAASPRGSRGCCRSLLLWMQVLQPAPHSLARQQETMNWPQQRQQQRQQQQQQQR